MVFILGEYAGSVLMFHCWLLYTRRSSKVAVGVLLTKLMSVAVGLKPASTCALVSWSTSAEAALRRTPVPLLPGSGIHAPWLSAPWLTRATTVLKALPLSVTASLPLSEFVGQPHVVAFVSTA